MPDDLAGELRRLLADAAADAAARERSQERTLRAVAESEATFAGVILDLAERGTTILVRTIAGRLHRGRVVGVGASVLALQDGGRPPVLLTVAGVTSARPDPAVDDHGLERATDVSGNRPAPIDVPLGQLLAVLAEDRPRVQVAVPGDEPVAGELRAVGSDVVTLRLDGRRLVHLRLAAVVEVVLLGGSTP